MKTQKFSRYAEKKPMLTSQSISTSLDYMRTTLDIPEELIEEARLLLGFKSKTDTVVLSLQELIRRRRIEQLKSLLGAVELDIDIPRSRRRS
ncbi:MAG TPA: type II toxin-antitoxin system VapB family antitoxin [Thermoanaerobaculia bacterium]|nr:type II toxin-antitoxin system VapB family antitoxin [Thermoanaerobaculia bacterium]